MRVLKEQVAPAEAPQVHVEAQAAQDTEPAPVQSDSVTPPAEDKAAEPEVQLRVPQDTSPENGPANLRRSRSWSLSRVAEGRPASAYVILSTPQKVAELLTSPLKKRSSSYDKLLNQDWV